MSFPPVGICIAKSFPPYGTFFGQVVFYMPVEGTVYCRVAYEDGDTEDMAPATVWEHATDPGRLLIVPLEVTMPTEEEEQEGATFHLDDKHREVDIGNVDAAGEEGVKESDSHLRRSQREKTSTVVYVGKDAVKRTNNYTVRGGTYRYGTFAEAGPPPSKVRKVQVQRAKPLPKQRTPSAEEKARMEMKMRMETNIQQKRAAKQAFLWKNRHVLAPFCPTGLPETAPDPFSSDVHIHQEVMQPDAIKAELRDYQLDGLNFMSAMYQQNMGMILGDEMGLGKTVQTLSLICQLKEKWNQAGPSLIVCPLSVLYSWCNELGKWAPSLKYLRFHGNQLAEMAKQDFYSYDVLITTYEMLCVSDLKNKWFRSYFNLVVLDEGHRIKCPTTFISQAVRKLHAECRIILTGTPLANNLTELWALLNFLEPQVFATSAPFDDAFNLTMNRIDNVKLEQAHQVLKVIMLRRLKVHVEQKLPPKLETRVVCPLSTTQIFWYKAILLKDLSLITGAGKKNAGALSFLLTQLRKCCQHPFLFQGAEHNPDRTGLDELIGNSGKLAVLDLLLQSLYKKQHRVTLFSQFTRVLDILEDYCRLRGWKFCRFDGSTARARRNHIINVFNAKGSDKFIFLMTTRSGGMGINLQTADTCILYDSDWNPQPDIQAIGRTHRLGQKKTVHVYRLCTLGTVEQRMQERAEKKLYLDRMVTKDKNFSEEMIEEDKEGKLLSTLRFGCNAVFGSAMKVQKLPSVEEIDMITDRSRLEDYSNGRLKGGTDLAADTFDETKAMTSTMDFNGIDFQKLREQHTKSRLRDMNDIQAAWNKRQRKSRIVLVDGKGSGYGKAAVPVLAANDYDLLSGEKSVFERELGGRQALTPAKKAAQTFTNQDFCQNCGDGGELVCCPRCPMSMHLKCAGVRRVNHFSVCSHHHCSRCGKTPTAAGGLLYPCMACAHCYCEDDIPEKAIMLDNGCQRMEDLGFNIKNGVYVICSKQCECVARKEFGWKPEPPSFAPCPQPLDLSSFFGGQVDDVIERIDEEEDSKLLKRNRKSGPYGTKKYLKPAPTPSRSAPEVQAVAATPTSTSNMECIPPSLLGGANETAITPSPNPKLPPAHSDSSKENTWKCPDAIDLTLDDS